MVNDWTHVLLAVLSLVLPMLFAWLLINLPDLRKRCKRFFEGR